MPISVDIGNYGSERLGFERRAYEVNLYPPTRVVAAYDLNAIMMFPIAIALLSVPVLKCFESVQNVASKIPGNPDRPVKFLDAFGV
jgi:hypothetical protein